MQPAYKPYPQPLCTTNILALGDLHLPVHLSQMAAREGCSMIWLSPVQGLACLLYRQEEVCGD